MVTTRSKTNSLPAKRAAEPELINSAPKQKKESAPKKKAVLPKKREPAPKKSKSKANARQPALQSPPTTSTTTSLQSSGSNRFLNLPAELRIQVYLECLLDPAVIHVRTFRPYLTEPALLRVNKQLRNEASAIWYSENVFQIQGSSPAVRFLRSLSDHTLSSLKVFCIVTDAMSLEYSRDRIRHLLEEFGPRGLSRQAIRIGPTGGSVRGSGYSLNDVKRLIVEQNARLAATKAAKNSGLGLSMEDEPVMRMAN